MSSNATSHSIIRLISCSTTAYGAKAIIPGGLDLLVAGFSCVDFSSLNNSKKELAERGESGDTFFGIRDYIRVYRPKIVIFENVVGAPWLNAKEIRKNEKEAARFEGKEDKAKMKPPSTGLDTLMDQVGYDSNFVLLDTKRYYIPHTRRRGYMVCIDKSLYAKDEICSISKTPMIKADLHNWQRLVKKMAYPATAPATCFLLRSDDPRLESLLKFDDSKRKAIDWLKCYYGHEEYRDNLGLGIKKQLTNWTPGGAYVAEDFWKRSGKGMVDRVLDTLEIAHLRNLSRGFDDRYYE